MASGTSIFVQTNVIFRLPVTHMHQSLSRWHIRLAEFAWVRGLCVGAKRPTLISVDERHRSLIFCFLPRLGRLDEPSFFLPKLQCLSSGLALGRCADPSSVNTGNPACRLAWSRDRTIGQPSSHWCARLHSPACASTGTALSAFESEHQHRQNPAFPAAAHWPSCMRLFFLPHKINSHSSTGDKRYDLGQGPTRSHRRL